MDGLRRCGEFGIEFRAFLRDHRGELPQIVTEDAPFDPCFAVSKAFASQWCAEVSIFEDSDSSLGGSPSFLKHAEAFVFEFFFEHRYGARTDAVDKATLVEIRSAFGGIEAAITRITGGLTVVFDNARKAGFYKFAVGGRLFLNEFPVDDKSVGLLREIESVSEFRFSIGFAAYEDVDVGVIEAEDFIGIGDAAFADDPFMGLMNGLRQLIEDELDAVEYHLSFELAPVGFAPAFFEHRLVVPGMAFNGLHEALHAAEYLFAHLLSVFLFPSMSHFDAELVHFPDKLFGWINAMIEAVFTNLNDTADQRLRSVSQQYPVDGKVKVGLHAGGICKDFIKAQGGFAVKQLACRGGIAGGSRDFMNELGQLVFWK